VGTTGISGRLGQQETLKAYSDQGHLTAVDQSNQLHKATIGTRAAYVLRALADVVTLGQLHLSRDFLRANQQEAARAYSAFKSQNLPEDQKISLLASAHLSRNLALQREHSQPLAERSKSDSPSPSQQEAVASLRQIKPRRPAPPPPTVATAPTAAPAPETKTEAPSQTLKSELKAEAPDPTAKSETQAPLRAKPAPPLRSSSLPDAHATPEQAQARQTPAPTHRNIDARDGLLAQIRAGTKLKSAGQTGVKTQLINAEIPEKKVVSDNPLANAFAKAMDKRSSQIQDSQQKTNPAASDATDDEWK